MEGQCIFECQFKGRKFRVIAKNSKAVESMTLYWTFEDGRIFDVLPWTSEEGAIGSILCEYSKGFITALGRIYE